MNCSPGDRPNPSPEKGGQDMGPKKCVLLVCLCFAIMAGTGNAEERFGAVVYPGAKHDSGVSEFLKQMLPQSAAYRTGDSVEKVVEFYKKQAGFTLVGPRMKEGAMFRKGTVDVTIQSPWMDAKTGKMMNDTLISIVNQPR
jgi:hypothetical protein